MALAWTKYWNPADDGRTLKAVDLRNIQDDIDAYITVNPTSGTVLTTTDQTISGIKTFTALPIGPGGGMAQLNTAQAFLGLTTLSGGVIIENRTDDTGCTQTGRIWIRTNV